MRLSLYQPSNDGVRSFVTFLISKDEVRFLCNGFAGGTPKLKIRGTLKDGLVLTISDQGYSLGSPLLIKNYGPDVGAVTQVACSVLGARQGPPVKPPLVIEPELTTVEGKPTVKLKGLPELTIEGAAPFNPALAIPKEADEAEDTEEAAEEAEKTPEPAMGASHIENGTPPPAPSSQTRREQILATVARHTHNDPEVNFSKPSEGRTPPPWDRPRRLPAPQGTTVKPPAAPIPPMPPPIAARAPAPRVVEAVIPTAASIAGDNARIDFRAAIELVNDAIAHSSGALGISVKDGKLRGFTRKIIEEEL